MQQWELKAMQKRTQYMHKMLANGYIFVSVNELETYRQVLSKVTFNRLLTAVLNGETQVAIKPKEHAALFDKLQEYNKQCQLLSRTAQLNDRGIELERYDDITAAIQVYEQNIELGFPAHHAFRRLLVLYRKQKDYANELRVCRRACRVFPKEQSYKDRYEKVKVLLAKAKASGK